MPVNPELTDQQLFELLQNGNSDAFDALYKKYWKKLLYRAIQKIDSQEDAEELVQDIFIDLWNSRKRIKIDTSVHLYIAAMLRYKIIATIAKRKKQIYYTTNEIDVISIQDHSTEQWLSFEETRVNLETVISTLPDKCQIVFRLSREEGLSDRQIADDLGVSKKNVEAHISRALKILRDSILQFLILLP